MNSIKYIRQILLNALLFLPVYVFAHGEQIIFDFVMPFIFSAIVFLVILVLLRLRPKSKMMILAVYILSCFFAFYLTSDWPYDDNKNFINLIVIFAPLLMASFAFIAARWREKTLRRKDAEVFLKYDNKSA